MKSSSSSSFSSSSSSRSPPQHKYDVFLSFHGKDTRKSFTDHLYAALVLHGIVTFKDDINLNRGENINYGLPKAIEESRISVVVFSKNYAESEWCLEELVKMMECSKRSHQPHTVLPIFYDVKPSEVRAQKGSVADSLAKHQNCGPKVEKWRETLHEFANLSGYVIGDLFSGHEGENIQKIVRDIEGKLNHMSLSIADHLVGIESHQHRVIEMLNMNCDNTRIIAICGIGGIGKTEIAKAVYNMVHRKFEGSSFIADVRATSDQPNGMVLKQEQILYDILKIKNLNIGSVHQGIELIKRRIFCRKVLLVLDDVDHAKQLKELAINRNFLYRGSKIIVTTRDISSINSLEVDEVYEPVELNKCQSIELFSWHAFKQDHPMEDYTELSNIVVSYLKGIPLALEVIGSLLFKKTNSMWKSAIRELKKIPNDKVQEKLKISFDSLSEQRKELFLDIACFFVGWNKDLTMEILEGCGFHPEIGMQELVERCLLKYDQFNKIMMHDLLKDMGREIIRQQSAKEPGERSRLWHHKVALKVLIEGTGTNTVEGLFLDFPKPRDVQANEKAFEKMVRLRLLNLNYVQLTVGYEHIISRRLVLLCWKGFPLDCIPSNLHMENLVYLDLSYSSLKYVWMETKRLDKLKFFHLNHCSSLIKTPDFSGLNNLVQLSLNDCTSLVEVDESISYLNKIVDLDMRNCKKLEKLPSSIWMMKSLESLDLSGFSNLRNFAGFKGSPSISWYSYVKNLVAHDSSYNSPEHVLEGIEFQNKLKILRLSRCSSLVKTPDFFALGNLEKLLLDGCTNLTVVDESISCLNKLSVLNMRNCKKLRTLPYGIWMLKSLEYLDLSDCSNLRNFARFKGSPSTLLYSFFSSWILPARKVGSVDLQVAKSHLKRLSMAGCNLSYIPNEIGCLTSLELLDISQNNFSTLPDGIGDLRQLKYLYVNKCKRLQSIPKTIGHLTSLQDLNMSGCNLSYIPNEMGYLTSLGDLDISQNNFSTLPDSIGDSPNLRFLNVDECRRLQSVPKLPPRLVVMSAFCCKSLESISMEAKWQNEFGPVVRCCGCPKLAENNFVDKCIEGLLQCKETSIVGIPINIYLPGAKVPNWFKYRSTGSSLSFVASTKILGWIVCATFTPPKNLGSFALGPTYSYQKNSSDQSGRGSGCPLFDRRAHKVNNVMWFSYLPFSAVKLRVKCGDEVKIQLNTRPYGAEKPFQLIEWGISLIPEDEDQEEEWGISLLYKDEDQEEEEEDDDDKDQEEEEEDDDDDEEEEEEEKRVENDLLIDYRGMRPDD